jgi:predicted transcriptional regulator
MEETTNFSRRERQIMDAIFELGEATVNDVLSRIEDPPSRTSLRTLMRIMEEKGHIKHKQRGREFLYFSCRQRKRAGRSAFRRVLRTYFNGSLEEALEALVTDQDAELDGEDLRNAIQTLSLAMTSTEKPLKINGDRLNERPDQHGMVNNAA